MTDTTSNLIGPAALATLSTTVAATALSTWGSYAFVLIVLGLMLWRSHHREGTLKDELTAARTEIRDLERLRLEDAKQLIRVTESSTALTTARAQGDETFQTTFRDLVTRLVEVLSTIELKPEPGSKPALPRPRRAR